MLRSLCRTVSSNISGDCSNTHLIRVHFISTSASSSPNHKKSSSPFVVDYLINSCGLSENQAITASKKLNFETSTKPDSVLDLLENSGFTKPNISKLITKLPRILLYNPQKTLQPKFDFLKSRGFSGVDLAKFLSSSPSVLETSLQDAIIPRCDTLKNIVHCDKNVVNIIKRNAWLLTGNVLKNLLVNLKLLRDTGLPESNVSKFLINHPISLTINTGKFEDIVQQIKGMGFDPSQTAFLGAIKGLTAMSKSTWETKLNAYSKWGLTEEEIENAFKKCPRCMRYSEKKIMSTMDYLVNQMGYNPSLIAKSPVILSLSLEKRIIPRCVVSQFLVSKGQIQKQIPLEVFTKTEKSFLEKYVNKYEAEVPEVLEVYHASLTCTSLASNDINSQ